MPSDALQTTGWRRYRIVSDTFNLKSAPWTGAIGIEDTGENITVPALVCWFTRGHGQRQMAEKIVHLLNSERKPAA